MNSALEIPSPISVEEYLATEPLSDIKYEYLAGYLYAMPGAREAHNRLASNLVAALVNRLRGKQCEAFGSDMKVRLHWMEETFLYYPDAMIACDPSDVGSSWRERPTVIFEIISEATRTKDEAEKRSMYLRLPSLEAYVRLEQTRPAAIVDHRGAEWHTERLTGLIASIELPTLGIELPLSELYDRFRF